MTRLAYPCKPGQPCEITRLGLPAADGCPVCPWLPVTPDAPWVDTDHDTEVSQWLAAKGIPPGSILVQLDADGHPGPIDVGRALDEGDAREH